MGVGEVCWHLHRHVPSCPLLLLLYHLNTHMHMMHHRYHRCVWGVIVCGELLWGGGMVMWWWGMIVGGVMMMAVTMMTVMCICMYLCLHM